jgi:hypothetical protein
MRWALDAKNKLTLYSGVGIGIDHQRRELGKWQLVRSKDEEFTFADITDEA